MKTLQSLLFVMAIYFITFTQQIFAQVVISEVYGGGGNSGSIQYIRMILLNFIIRLTLLFHSTSVRFNILRRQRQVPGRSQILMVRLHHMDFFSFKKLQGQEGQPNYRLPMLPA
jgi:hypothetical protein